MSGAVLLILTFSVLWLIRSRNFARNKQKLQVSFTKDILKTQENERARIAGELHDSIGQKLLILKNALVGNNNKADKEIDLVGETIKEVREMSHSLHPFQFEKLGLVQSLKNMVETFQKNSNIFYSEDIEILENSIAKEKAIYIFRMLQEAITNVEKHAEATACNLSALEEKKQVIFILKDNGKGFVMNKNPTESKGLGMKTLEERARFIQAELNIDSILTKGTTMTLRIPKK
jgi:signal transduction histidine kinase